MSVPEQPLPSSRLQEIMRGKHAEWMLVVVSVVESWFMPIIIEPFMVLPVLARPDRWFRIATIVTASSVIGGTCGYLTGLFFFDIIGARLIALYGMEGYLAKTVEAFNDNVFWVIFAGAFTPLPYKIFTLIGGFLHANFFMFIVASLLGRGLRFYAVAFVLARFGERAFPIFLRNFNLALSVLVAAIALYAAYSFL